MQIATANAQPGIDQQDNPSTSRGTSYGANQKAGRRANQGKGRRSNHQDHRATQSVIGKTVTGVISRPADGGRDCLLVLQFSDGSCFEFVSPAAQRNLSRGRHVQPEAAPADDSGLQQLSFFPHDGNPSTSSAPVF